MKLPPSTRGPWYREPWPWLLMAPPVASIALGIVMWTLAAQTDDGLVANDYYKRGLAINQKVKQAAAKRELRLGAIVRIDNRGEIRPASSAA